MATVPCAARRLATSVPVHPWSQAQLEAAAMDRRHRCAAGPRLAGPAGPHARVLEKAAARIRVCTQSIVLAELTLGARPRLLTEPAHSLCAHGEAGRSVRCLRSVEEMGWSRCWPRSRYQVLSDVHDGHALPSVAGGQAGRSLFGGAPLRLTPVNGRRATRLPLMWVPRASNFAASLASGVGSLRKAVAARLRPWPSCCWEACPRAYPCCCSCRAATRVAGRRRHHSHDADRPDRALGPQLRLDLVGVLVVLVLVVSAQSPSWWFFNNIYTSHLLNDVIYRLRIGLVRKRRAGPLAVTSPSLRGSDLQHSLTADVRPDNLGGVPHAAHHSGHRPAGDLSGGLCG